MVTPLADDIQGVPKFAVAQGFLRWDCLNPRESIDVLDHPRAPKIADREFLPIKTLRHNSQINGVWDIPGLVTVGGPIIHFGAASTHIPVRISGELRNVRAVDKIKKDPGSSLGHLSDGWDRAEG
jgi:hypothetical protein